MRPISWVVYTHVPRAERTPDGPRFIAHNERVEASSKADAMIIARARYGALFAYVQSELSRQHAPKWRKEAA